MTTFRGQFLARHFLTMVAALVVFALISACAVGPDFHRPPVSSVEGYTRQPLTTTARVEIPGGEEQRFVEGQDISHQWWILYQSPQLNALIDRAVKNNPTLVAAQTSDRTRLCAAGPLFSNDSDQLLSEPSAGLRFPVTATEHGPTALQPLYSSGYCRIRAGCIRSKSPAGGVAES